MIKRTDFPILTRKIKGRTLVYFDNAATAQKPRAVIAATVAYYKKYNANVHRSLNPLADEATKRYEAARDTIAAAILARREEVIFTRGATEGINLVARTWGAENLKPNDRIVLSLAEHHANIVPWLQLQAKIGFKLDYIPVKDSGALDIQAARRLLSRPRVRLLALTQASNVLGVVNPLGGLIRLAKSKKIITLIDAAQSAAHRPINVRSLGCDFLVLSGHKIWGPTGIGILYGRRELLEAMPPFLGGGDMISAVYPDHFLTNSLPYKFEAGTPNIAGAIGLGAAVAYINQVSWPEIKRRERALTAYFLKKIKTLKFVQILGTAQPKLPVFSLLIKGIHPHDAADLLGEEGIILRAGHHCAQPLHERYGVAASLRASLSFYNTEAEIDFFVKKLQELYQAFQ
ncbi:MAG: SufS family cysteine desulfurase [Patescibacteria group bacterium]